MNHDALVESLAPAVAELLGEPITRLGPLCSLIEEQTESDPNQSRQVVRELMAEINARLFPAITHLELLLAEWCNLTCSYCFAGSVVEPGVAKTRMMSRATIEGAIDLLFDYSRDSSAVDITFLGGEPTLNFRGIQIAVEYAEARASQSGKTANFHMTSNGTVCTSEMLKYYRDHRINVLLSIDGMATTHNRYRVDKSGRGSFDTVIANMQKLKKYQPWIGAKMTVSPDAADRVCDDVRGLRGLGVNQFIIGHATGVQWDKDRVGAYRDQLSELRDWYWLQDRDELRISMFDEDPTATPSFGCRAARNSIAVGCSGQIAGCSRILTLKVDQSVGLLGDLEHGLYEINSRRDSVDCERLKANCSEQGVFDGYRGGCFAVNYEDQGDLYVPSLEDDSFSRLVEDVVACGLRPAVH